MSYAGRRRYFAADRTAGRAMMEVASTPNPRVRSAALRTVAQCERTQAAFAWAFPDAGDRDEDGFTLAASHSGAACLVDLVAGTERSLADRTPLQPGRGAALALIPAAAEVLTALCTTGEPRARAELVLALGLAVVGQVGGQAAEVLPAIAARYYQLAGLSWHDATRLVWPHVFGGEETTP